MRILRYVTGALHRFRNQETSLARDENRKQRHALFSFMSYQTLS